MNRPKHNKCNYTKTLKCQNNIGYVNKASQNYKQICNIFWRKNIKKMLNNIRDFLNYFELSMRKSNGRKIQVKESNKESV